MPLSQISGSADGIFVHGARSYDNNYELDGISVNDVQGSGSSSGGIPIPNPDLIQEFKVQTGLFLICKSVLVQPTRAQRSKPLSRNLSRPRPLSRRLCRTVRELPQRFMLSRPFFAPPGFNSTL